jgi:hypothetical protein
VDSIATVHGVIVEVEFEIGNDFVHGVFGTALASSRAFAVDAQTRNGDGENGRKGETGCENHDVIVLWSQRT